MDKASRRKDCMGTGCTDGMPWSVLIEQMKK
jgi:hypothetical protein